MQHWHNQLFNFHLKWCLPIFSSYFLSLTFCHLIFFYYIIIAPLTLAYRYFFRWSVLKQIFLLPPLLLLPLLLTSAITAVNVVTSFMLVTKQIYVSHNFCIDAFLPQISLWSDTVECYNLKKNEWTFVANMVEPHYGHAGTVHGDLMYISGNTGQHTVSVHFYCLRVF